MRKCTNRKVKSPPYSHREIARAIFNFEENRYSLATWLKVELYNLLMTVLPKLIALAVWIVVIAAVYCAVTLI